MKHGEKTVGPPLPASAAALPGTVTGRLRARAAWLGALGVLSLMGCAPGARADAVNAESLGVVNGSITARGQMVEIKPFLSGRPLYQYDALDAQPPVSTLVIEHAQAVSGGALHDGLVWMQQPLTLAGPAAAGQQAVFRMPLQVEAEGKAVEVSVREDSRGLMLTLPRPARQVRVRPAGPINFILPVTWRGEVQADIRITGNTASAASSQE